MLFEYQRFLPETKTINYLPAIWLLPKLKTQGAIEPLYHFKGKILETARGNFFLVKNNTLITPKENILLGITRKYLIECARKNFEIEEREVTIEEIDTADEIFITGTSKHVLPVTQIDNKIIADGKPGVVTLRLMEAFNRSYNLKKDIEDLAGDVNI